MPAFTVTVRKAIAYTTSFTLHGESEEEVESFMGSLLALCRRAGPGTMDTLLQANMAQDAHMASTEPEVLEWREDELDIPLFGVEKAE